MEVWSLRKERQEIGVFEQHRWTHVVMEIVSSNNIDHQLSVSHSKNDGCRCVTVMLNYVLKPTVMSKDVMKQTELRLTANC